MILAIRTDKPESELYIFAVEDKLDQVVWQADRKLADELLPKIKRLLNKNNVVFDQLTGIIIFTGEGSFTGLRIGTTVANTMAYSLSIPIVDGSGEDWLQTGLSKIKTAKLGNYIVPKYSSEPNITKPKA